MKHLTLEEVQSQLATLVKAGEPVEITQNGVLVARLEPTPAVKGTIDIAALQAHRARLTSPVQDTQAELDAWKAENRY